MQAGRGMLRAEDGPDGVLRALREVRALSPARAQAEPAVEVEGVVTFVDPPRHMLFVQDGTGGVFVEPAQAHALQPGTRVRLTGRARVGRFTPYVRGTELRPLGMEKLPAAPWVDIQDFKAGFRDGERVAVAGRVTSTKLDGDRMRLRLAVGGEALVAWLYGTFATNDAAWRDAQLRVAGVCTGEFSEAGEITDFTLHVAGSRDVEVLSPAPLAGGVEAPRPIRELEVAWGGGQPARVRCRGRVTLHWPGRYLFMTDGTGSIELRAEEVPELAPGDEIEATGVRTVAHRRMILAECAVQRLGAGPRVEPVRTALEGVHSRHRHGEWVELEGEVSVSGQGVPGEVDGRAGPEGESAAWLVIRQNDWYLRADLRPGSRPMAEAASTVGSRVRVRGVLAARPAVPGESLTYALLVEGPEAIEVLRRAPWWTMRRLAWIGGGVGALAVSGLGWAMGLSERRRRKAEEAIRERRERAGRHREALLELTRLVRASDGEKPLPAITELVSRTVEVARVSVWRLEEDGGGLRCLDRFDGTGHHSGERLEASRAPAYFAALGEARIIAAEDARTDARTRDFASGYLEEHGIGAMLDVPLRFRGKPAGVLCLEHVGGARIWDDDEQTFAAAVSDQLTILREAWERQRAERELREAHAELEVRVALRTTELAEARDRAEAADRLKSAFLATMSHELRTPLNSILGFTGILLQGLVGTLNPEQKKQLGMIQNSSRHLLSLINDVLDISKIEAGQFEVVRTSFDVREVVTRVAELMLPLAEKKGLVLGIRLEPGVGPLTSDRRRVEQILLNLVSNAVKFTERGEVRIEGRIEGGTLELAVVDTGPGIPEAQLGRLFKPFQQLDTGLARQHEGTGLGLAICAGLAKLLGGSMQVESRLGEGSRFVLLLSPEEARTT